MAWIFRLVLPTLVRLVFLGYRLLENIISPESYLLIGLALCDTNSGVNVLALDKAVPMLKKHNQKLWQNFEDLAQLF